LAVALLQKYCCKVLISKVSPTKVSIQECLQNQGISFSEENFVTEIDLNDAGISLVALETTTREAIPSMEGKIFASICGPFSQDWKKQIEICRERNVSGIISEILPDELPSNIGINELQYFCNTALFLPPCIPQDEQSMGNHDYETIILKEGGEFRTESDFSAKIQSVFPILEQLDEFEIIQYSNSTDGKKIFENFGKSRAIYNLLHYPQLNLFLKLKRDDPILLNQESSWDSPLRNFLSDYSPLEFESSDQFKQLSVRTQVLNFLAKNRTNMPRCSKEVLSHFSASSLLPYLEKKLNLSEGKATGDRLEALHMAMSWESLVNCNVHVKQFPHIKTARKENGIYMDSFLHPAGSSALLALLKEKNEFAGSVFLNSAFARKILCLPNSSSTTHLFIELLEYDPKKWMGTCEKVISSGNALRLAELLYFSCLLAKDESTQKERISLATVFCNKLLSNNLSLHHKAHAFKAKLKLLNSKNKLSTEDFPGWETQLQMFLQEVYLVSEQELFMPDFRSNAQDFIDQFIQLFFQNPKDSEKNNQDWATLFSATDRIDEGLEIMQNLMAKGRIPFAYVLHYICITFCSTNKAQVVLPLIDQFEKQLSTFKPFNFWSRLYILVISSLKRDTQPMVDTIEELLTEHKHISNTLPISYQTPLLFLHLGKALQSQEIEDKALSLGNNHFFTFINSQDFGEAPTIPAKDRSTLLKGVSEFIAAAPQMLLT
jgi:hypothetical protein